MVSEKEYDILMNKYNVAVSRIKDLMKTLEDKEKSYKVRDVENAQINKNAREFCEKILAKDKNEMKLSGNYTWNSLSTVELITRAEKAYNAFNDDRNKLLQELMNQVEHRGAVIETLKEQIIILQNDGNASDSTDPEEMLKDKQAKEKFEAKNGAGGKNVTHIKEDDEDVEESEIDHLENAMKDGLTTMPAGISYKTAPSKKETVKAETEKKTLAVVQDILKSYNQWTDNEKAVFNAIAQGQSRLETIAASIGAGANQNNLFNNIASELKKRNVIEGTKISTPLTASLAVYKLTDIGKTLYKKISGHEPAIAEMDRIVKEHSDLEHGYGIIQIANKMKSSKKYLNVSEFNRSKPMQIPNTTNCYVPDIIYIINENGKPEKHYIEYETGHSFNYSEIRTKLNKMFCFTRTAEIIVRNATIRDKYIDGINKYVEMRNKSDAEKGIPAHQRFLSGKKIRITTAQWFIRNIVQGNSKEWDYHYDFDLQNEVITLPNPITD